MIVIDMKRPETCADCHIINGEYGICEILDRTVWGTPPEDCPIVGEIPDNHGRVIDADLLKSAHCKDCKDNCVYCDSAYVLDMIDEAPTILEATE